MSTHGRYNQIFPSKWFRSDNAITSAAMQHLHLPIPKSMVMKLQLIDSRKVSKAVPQENEEWWRPLERKQWLHNHASVTLGYVPYFFLTRSTERVMTSLLRCSADVNVLTGPEERVVPACWPSPAVAAAAAATAARPSADDWGGRRRACTACSCGTQRLESTSSYTLTTEPLRTTIDRLAYRTSSTMTQ